MQSTRESCENLRNVILLRLEAKKNEHLKPHNVADQKQSDSKVAVNHKASDEKTQPQKLPEVTTWTFDLKTLCDESNIDNELKDTSIAFKNLVTLLIQETLNILGTIDAKVIEAKLKLNLLPGTIVTFLKNLNFILAILCNKEYLPEIFIDNFNFVMPSNMNLYNDDLLKKLYLLGDIVPLLRLEDLNDANSPYKFAALGHAQSDLAQFFSAIMKILYPDPDAGGKFITALTVQTPLNALIEQKKILAEHKSEPAKPKPSVAKPAATSSVLATTSSFFYNYSLGLIPNPMTWFHPPSKLQK